MALALTVSACSSLSPHTPTEAERTSMEMKHYEDHVQAKGEIETLYQETIALVGEDWWGNSEYEWRGCGRSGLRDTDSWARVNRWHGPIERTPQQIANDVAALWRSLGYPVTVQSDDTLEPPRKIVSYPPYLTGTTPEGFGAVFSIGDDYAGFRGYSRCVDQYPELDDRHPDSTTDR
jgi:hypothetical protein